MPKDKKNNTTSNTSKVKKFKETLAINREKQKLINEWIKVMTHSKTYNRHMDTFEIVDETMTIYGWSFKLLCPWLARAGARRDPLAAGEGTATVRGPVRPGQADR